MQTFSNKFLYGFHDIILTTILLFTISSGIMFSQEGSTINLKKIHQKKVRSFLVSNDISTKSDFTSVNGGCYENLEDPDFHFHERIFTLRTDIDDVWEGYNYNNTIEEWEGDFIRFGLMLSKNTNTVVYYDDLRLPAVETGQIYFLNLRILKGLIKVPMAFEVTRVDSENRIIELGYIEGNIEQGKQVLHFIEAGKGKTKIIHRSYFKSESGIRDALFYPYFHNRIIKDYHRNMKHYINSEKHHSVKLQNI